MRYSNGNSSPAERYYRIILNNQPVLVGLLLVYERDTAVGDTPAYSAARLTPSLYVVTPAGDIQRHSLGLFGWSINPGVWVPATIWSCILSR